MRPIIPAPIFLAHNYAPIMGEINSSPPRRSSSHNFLRGGYAIALALICTCKISVSITCSRPSHLPFQQTLGLCMQNSSSDKLFWYFDLICQERLWNLSWVFQNAKQLFLSRVLDGRVYFTFCLQGVIKNFLEAQERWCLFRRRDANLYADT